MSENTMTLFFNCHANLIIDKDTHKKIKHRKKKLKKLVKIVPTRPGEVCTIDPDGIIEYKAYVQDMLTSLSEAAVFHRLSSDKRPRPWKTRYLLSEEREPEIVEEERVGFMHTYSDNSFMEKLFEVSDNISTEEELKDYMNQGIFLLKDYTWTSKKGKTYRLPAGFNFMRIEDLVTAEIKDDFQEMIEELENDEDTTYKWLINLDKRQSSWVEKGPYLQSIFLSDLIFYLVKKLKVENLYYIDMTCSTLEIHDGHQRDPSEKIEIARTYSETLGGNIYYKKKSKKTKKNRIVSKKKISANNRTKYKCQNK